MSWRDRVLLFAVLVTSSAPFWGKAFHIDDAFFIAVAENVRRHPLRPFHGATAMDDIDRRLFADLGQDPSTFQTLSHPPLVPYVIAAGSLLAGAIREAPEHAAFLVFSMVAAGSQYRLARRFAPEPFRAALFLVSSAVFILAGHSLMTDLPALALFLAALALFIEGVDAGDARRLLASGLLAGLAVLTRYVCLGLLPLGLVYVLGRKRAAGRAWLALLPLVIVLGLWAAQNRLAHGAVHLTASARHYAEYYQGRYWTAADLGRRAIADVAALGATALPVAVLMALAGGLGRRARPLGLCVLSGGLAVWLAPLLVPELRAYGPWHRAVLALFLAAGLFLLAEGIRRARGAGTDGSFLLFWLGGALAGTVLLLPFGTARYMLLVLPPLFLLLCRGEGPVPTGRGALVAGASSLALGLLLAVADQEYAGAYRDFARRVPAVAGNHRVWFIGDWGFRYYMEQAGHRYLLSSDDTPSADDFIVRPQIAGLHEMAPGLKARSQRVTTVAMPGRLPIRLMSFEARAGYYSHHWGFLPFALSRAPLERFDVFRVVAPPS